MSMKMKKTWKMISVFLCCAMLLGLMPLTAHAEEESGTTFYRVTDVEHFVEGRNYVITYSNDTFEDGKIATLNHDGNIATFVDAKWLKWDKSDTLFVPEKDNDCILQLNSKNESGYNFTNVGTGVPFRLGNDDGLFDSNKNARRIQFTYNSDLKTWKIAGGPSHSLTYDVTYHQFNRSGGSSSTEFEIWTDIEPDSTYSRLSSLDELENVNEFVITLPDPNTGEPDKYIMGAFNGDGVNGWLSDKFSIDDSGILTATAFSVFTHGDLTLQKDNEYQYEYIQLTINNQYWHPSDNMSTKVPFTSTPTTETNNNVMRFAYGDKTENGSQIIYLRGNGGSSYLGYKDGVYTRVSFDDENIIPIRIYAHVTGEKVPTYYVNFYDTQGNVENEINTQNGISLYRPADEVDKGYIFLGWSTVKPQKTYLDKIESANLYDYNYDLKLGTYKDSTIKKYSLVGNGNAEKLDTLTVEQLEKLATDGVIDLYPIYAVRGDDTVITAKEGSQSIVGISDWKSLQDDEGQFRDVSKEKWLGSIDVEVYRDGKIWVESTPMYFSYHNDNAADINIKFIWDELVEEYANKYPGWPKDLNSENLYKYMYDKDQFPEYDQLGHFVIDGVYAEQGISEDGLKYKYNWMSEHGGQLDNVKGGSTIRIYVTTKYNALYYLDDELITDENWHNPTDYYTTKGTENKFKEDTKNVKEYAVTKDNLVELMDPDITDGSLNDQNSNLKRGEYTEFSYFINDYDHEIPVAEKPTQDLIVAMKGDSGKNLQLVSENWSLKDESNTEQEKVAWDSVYAVTGTTRNTGNTVYSYVEDNVVGQPEADKPYTYHFYAYTDVPETSKPKTSDNNQMETWTILMTVSLAGMCFVTYKTRKKSSIG